MKKYLYRLTIYTTNILDHILLTSIIDNCDKSVIKCNNYSDNLVVDLVFASEFAPEVLNKVFDNAEISNSTEYILQLVNGISGTIYDEKVSKFISKYHG